MRLTNWYELSGRRQRCLDVIAHAFTKLDEKNIGFLNRENIMQLMKNYWDQNAHLRYKVLRNPRTCELV